MLIPSSPVMACLKNTLYGISKATLLGKPAFFYRKERIKFFYKNKL